MPIDPHTWSDITDYWTPTIVNGDLYRYQGQEFAPTGIQFHARRPIYKAYMAGNPGPIAAGAEGNVFATASDNVSNANADTGALFGSYMDPFTTGNFRLRIANGGGQPGSDGGLGLAIGYTAWPTSSSGSNVSAGFGPSAGSSSTNFGMFQGLNPNAGNTMAFVIDLIDLDSQRWGVFGLNGTTGILNMYPGNADGSGSVSRAHAHWVSVYPSNGFTAAVPAPVQAWSDGSTLSAALLNGNTGIRDVLRYLNMPPLVSAQAPGTNQGLTANVDNQITGMSAVYSTYGGFSSNTYTVPRDGVYFVHGIVTCTNFSGELSAGVNINGTTYYGPRANMPGSNHGSASKTQIFSLRAGDTVKLIANPSAAASTSSTHPGRLIVLNVGCLGAPAVLPIPPDTTFRWTAGSPGSLSQLFNNHVANDLLFLTQRPYLLSYQSTARDTASMNALTPVTMDAQTGLIHGDDGDNYNGWDSVNNRYTAQVAGWYMAVQETFLAAPSVTNGPWVGAAFQVGPHPGSQTWDQFQKWDMSTSTGHYPGATAVTYYYLRAGDTLRPGVVTGNSSNTTINTVSEAARRSHFELVYLGE